MNLLDVKKRVRSYLRDFSNSIFREADVVDYVNEAMERIIQLIPELKDMNILRENNDEVTLLPRAYHSLLAIYSASRCFSQDERHYQASTFMNEFEVKLNELKMGIENGEIHIVDADGTRIRRDNVVDFVADTYFNTKRRRRKPTSTIQPTEPTWDDGQIWFDDLEDWE